MIEHPSTEVENVSPRVTPIENDVCTARALIEVALHEAEQIANEGARPRLMTLLDVVDDYLRNIEAKLQAAR